MSIREEVLARIRESWVLRENLKELISFEYNPGLKSQYARQIEKQEWIITHQLNQYLKTVKNSPDKSIPNDIAEIARALKIHVSEATRSELVTTEPQTQKKFSLDLPPRDREDAETETLRSSQEEESPTTRKPQARILSGVVGGCAVIIVAIAAVSRVTALTPNPISTSTIIAVPTASSVPSTVEITRAPYVTQTEVVTLKATPEPTVLIDSCYPHKIAINEVMTVPQPPYGNLSNEMWNEYVEIYNYGDEEVDVRGMWIADIGGHPGRLIAWDKRNENIPVGAAQTTNTILLPGGYAVILPPLYNGGDRPYDDLIPHTASILTIENSDYIGDGLIGTEGKPLDVIVLYTGTVFQIDCVVSTYGTPKEPLAGKSLGAIDDDGADDLPYAIPIDGGWGGFQKVFPDGPDTPSNWIRMSWEFKSPGWANIIHP
jgi:hypothetical protein